MKGSTAVLLAALGVGFALTRRKKSARVHSPDASTGDRFHQAIPVYMDPCGAWSPEDADRAWSRAEEKIRSIVGVGPDANHPRNEQEVRELAFSAAYSGMFWGFHWAGCEAEGAAKKYLPMTIGEWKAAEASWPPNIRARWNEFFERALEVAWTKVRN